jgi:hypothetical protein
MHRYVEAMERKLDMAVYHLAVLRELLPFAIPDEDNLPPVPLQAHFESAGRAIVSMIDQLVSAVASVVPGMPTVHKATPKAVIRALADSTELAARELKEVIERLNDDARINDLRDVRNRSTHRFDEKDYLHGGGWTVNPPQHVRKGVRTYEGPRGLSQYLQVMVEYGQAVLATVPRAEKLAESLAAHPG